MAWHYLTEEGRLVHKYRGFMNLFFIKNRKYQYIFGFSIAILLIVSSYAIADTTEDTAETAEAPAPKKSPIKVGGAMRVNYAYGA
ncbi:MAG: hypothetical protein OXI61_02835, partial [Candidatus Poribacteria bacterium]|nr:hypothetical protein [Candidatus Poribacteria bacterium]